MLDMVQPVYFISEIFLERKNLNIFFENEVILKVFSC